MTSIELPTIGFSSPSAFKCWLEAQPRNSPGAWIKFARKGAAEPTISKSDAIDLALAHGWIDGQLGRVDELYYKKSFYATKAKERLVKDKLRTRGEIDQVRSNDLAGIWRTSKRQRWYGRWDLAYAPQSTAVPHDDPNAALDADPSVRQVFKQLKLANRYAIIYRVHLAKTAEKRAAKIAELIAMLRRGETIHPRRGKPNPNS